MTININNQQQKILENSTLLELIQQQEISVQGIAIAINNVVIPKQQWEAVYVKEHDNIIIIHATQGG